MQLAHNDLYFEFIPEVLKSSTGPPVVHIG